MPIKTPDQPPLNPRDLATSPPDGMPAVIAGRYVVGNWLGSGGMGVAYQAKDLQFNRPAAIKTVLSEFSANDSKKARFVTECKITGLLQHPGIPPAYEHGTLPDGRPFLAMKMVRGETLAKLLGKRSHQSVDLARFVAVFEAVAQAVGYAHSKDVVHRDLKPDNVMVGEFGEVQVMDWGLAKELPRTPETTDGVIGIRRDDLCDLPHKPTSGAVGTLTYMAPEQAQQSLVWLNRSKTAGYSLSSMTQPSPPQFKLDHKRADVFGLGAILAVILTGEPPWVTATDKLLYMVCEGRLGDCNKRLTDCKAESDLLDLCRRCLAINPGERPANAKEVAEKVAEIRRTADERARQAEVAKGQALVREAEGKVREAQKKKQLKWLAGAGLVALAFGVVAGVQWRRAVAQERETANALADKTSEEQAKTLALAESAQNLAEGNVARAKTVEALKKLTDGVVTANIARKPSLTAEDRAFLREVLGLWQSVADTRGDTPEARHLRAEGAFRVGYVQQTLGESADAEAAYRASLAIQQQLTTTFPDRPEYWHNLASTYSNLGNLLRAKGRAADAEAAYGDALGARKKLANFPPRPEYQQRLAGIHNDLGHLQSDTGRTADAEASFRAALAIQHELTANFPDRPDYRQALADTHNNLGLVQSDTDRMADAEAAYRAALAIQHELTANFPDRPDYRQALANTHNNLGHLLRATGRTADAEAAFRVALGIREKLAAGSPARPDYRQELARTHNNLGILLNAAGRTADAEVAYRAALGAQEKLAADFPAVPGYRVQLGGSYCNFGNLLSRTGKLGDSLDWYAKAIATLAPVHAADPRQVTPQLYLRNSHLGRALTLTRLGRHTDAIADWDKVVELSPPAEQPPRRALRANSLVQAGQLDRAVAEAAELTALPEKWSAGQWYNFACVYAVASSKLADKREEYATRAVELLRKAVSDGFRDRAHMAKNTVLAPLRGRADFRAVLAALPEQAPPPRPAKGTP